jgi:hypothetical protein
MLEADVAPGVHRIEDAYTNWYLVEECGRLTVVDAGVPTSWHSFTDALARIGRSPSDVDAIVLTHAHFDHVGFAERARRELGVPVWVHEDDVPLSRNPMGYAHERGRSRYLVNPGALPIMASLLRNRAFWPQPIAEVRRFQNGALDVPGSPQVVFSPGHTYGHCALHFPRSRRADRGRRDRHARPLHRAPRAADRRPRGDGPRRRGAPLARRAGGHRRRHGPDRPRGALARRDRRGVPPGPRRGRPLRG